MEQEKRPVFDLCGEMPKFQTFANEIEDKIIGFIKSQGKTLWNFFNEENFGNELCAYSYSRYNTNLQRVKVCALIVMQDEEGNDRLGGLFLADEYEEEVERPMTDEEVLAYFNKPTHDFDTAKKFATDFSGRITLLSLLDNLSTQHYAI